jgi:hypothetical protein
MMQKQYKALSGGGVSTASIVLIISYLNTVFNLGLGADGIAAIAAMFGVLIYLVIYLVPNINPALINIDEVDIETLLTSVTKDNPLSPEIIKAIASSIRGIK